MKLTENDKRVLRENTNMRLFNFYLDDVTKLECLQRLRENGIETEKGALSALIRVLLNQFASSDSPEWVEMTCNQVYEEYVLTTKKNKRSKL